MKLSVRFGLIVLLTMAIGCQQRGDSEKTSEMTIPQADLISAMEKFHTVLRPLQHQAVPQGDIESIIREADELHKRAEQIQKATLPKNLATQKVAIDTLRRELFTAAEQLQMSARSFEDSSAVFLLFAKIHDQYESLADTIYTLEHME